MGRFDYYDEDEYRLPDGFRRVGYDADTQQYTFLDADGVVYTSAPGSMYGTLVPVRSDEGHYTKSKPSLLNIAVNLPPPKSFEEILSPELITTPASSSSEASPGFVQILKRSLTTRIGRNGLERSKTSAGKRSRSLYKTLP